MAGLLNSSLSPQFLHQVEMKPNMQSWKIIPHTKCFAIMG
ncbi:hypothetical protein COLO4_35192 [Corchorus olitorius]|uniref:Uncharacterized protein n=1 Tax=Corchorus olitorius TaxID=93759 RepID=A0A1R3GI07_9ROSI|nr:hypothetical protein COLO4_35192 [Corchorus olitorius]